MKHFCHWPSSRAHTACFLPLIKSDCTAMSKVLLADSGTQTGQNGQTENWRGTLFPDVAPCGGAVSRSAIAVRTFVGLHSRGPIYAQNIQRKNHLAFIRKFYPFDFHSVTILHFAHAHEISGTSADSNRGLPKFVEQRMASATWYVSCVRCDADGRGQWEPQTNLQRLFYACLHFWLCRFAVGASRLRLKT